MCDKAVKRSFPAFIYVPDSYKTQEIDDRVISEDLFMLVCCRDRYETQKMCDEAVDYFLAALKFITAWFVASEIINKRLITL